MKRHFFSFFLLLVFVFNVSAQKAQVADDTSQKNLRAHIEYLASDKLEGRRTGESGAALAAEYIAAQFKKVGLKPAMRGTTPYLQEFSFVPLSGNPHNSEAAGETAPAKKAFNVIGILPGTDKTLKQEAIVVGAHYDHLGKGGEGSLAANSTDIHHGADDNASGTAAIIELARQFAKEKKNKRTIIFIAFSGEESGLFGSKFYVNNPIFPIEKTIAMLNLDMVGRLNEKKLTIGGIGTASEWKILVERMLTGGGPIGHVGVKYLPILLHDFRLQLNEDGFGPSDHSSFYTKKVPVLFFFTGTHLDYHKPSDTADKINYYGLERVRQYVYSIARSVDQNRLKPTYMVAKSSGTPGGRMTFNVSLGTIPSYSDSTDGMVIDGVRDDSPASRAGLKGNDKIIKLAGKDIKNVMDYTKMLGEMKADVEYEIVILRDSETLNLKIVPAKRP